MIIEVVFLAIGLIMILIAAETFTNGIETFGRKFNFSQAVVGSLFAAVGTALPETILPIVAIFFYGGESAQDIGVGAILGAPFMLSTLAFFLVGLTVIISFLKKRRKFEINVEPHSTTRDLIFFLPMYAIAVVLPSIVGRSVSIRYSSITRRRVYFLCLSDVQRGKCGYRAYRRDVSLENLQENGADQF